MDRLHARYPFLAAAREAVEAAEVDLARVVAEEPRVVERGLERVESALFDGTVGEVHHRPRVELLSYPVARVMVSLVDEHVLVRRYARGEAATAHERFAAALEADTELKSAEGERLTREELLREFDLAGAVRADGEGYLMAVGTYLELAADQWGDKWRLVNRELTGGEVPVTEAELLELCQQAVRQRVATDLPFAVPDPIAEELTDEVDYVRERLADLDLTRDIDTVVPDLFPPCMKHLLDAVQKGEHLEHHSRFAIAAFLVSIGMSTDEIVELFEVNPGFGEEMTRYQVDHIRGATSPTEYSPPSCATMQSYGDCVNKDDICEDVIEESHPLNYYEHRLDDADEEELSDWRDAQDESAEESASKS